MKIAIFGNNQAAINLAVKFKEIDAQVTVFSSSELQCQEVEVRQCQVTQVSKLNLVQGETVLGRSRICDLFRVTFEMNTAQNLENQKKDNPSVFENLSQSMIATLQGKIEMAEDFDLVVDLRPSKTLGPIGKSNAYALNERIYSSHENFIENVPQSEIDGDCFIYGWGNSLAKTIIETSKKNIKNAFIFYPKGKTRDDLLNSVSKVYLSDLTKIFQALDKELEENKKAHEDALSKWNSYEDYERVKYPKPELKPLSFQEFFDMGVVSIDRLEEHDKFFITYEPYSKFDQSAATDVKTLGVKYIINAQKRILDEQIYHSLNKNEDGLFKIGEIENYEIEELFESLFNEIKKYFSKN